MAKTQVMVTTRPYDISMAGVSGYRLSLVLINGRPYAATWKGPGESDESCALA